MKEFDIKKLIKAKVSTNNTKKNNLKNNNKKNNTKNNTKKNNTKNNTKKNNTKKNNTKEEKILDKYKKYSNIKWVEKKVNQFI